MKYIVKPACTNEYWDIEVVVLALHAEDVEKLVRLQKLVRRCCKLSEATSMTFYKMHLSALALEELVDQPELSEWVNQAEENEFKCLPSAFDPDDHKTWRTDTRLTICDDGTIWVKMQNHYGDGELEVQLDEEMLTLIPEPHASRIPNP